MSLGWRSLGGWGEEFGRKEAGRKVGVNDGVTVVLTHVFVVVFLALLTALVLLLLLLCPSLRLLHFYAGLCCARMLSSLLLHLALRLRVALLRFLFYMHFAKNRLFRGAEPVAK